MTGPKAVWTGSIDDFVHRVRDEVYLSVCLDREPDREVLIHVSRHQMQWLVNSFTKILKERGSGRVTSKEPSNR